jgi:hypothetical protein
MMQRSLLSLLLVGVFTSLAGAFVPKTFSRPELTLAAAPQHQQFGMPAKIAAAVTVAAVYLAPLIALAEEDYEYGKVDAPISMAVGGGILAILTALLPVLLKGGETAFEEIREREADTFGAKDNKNVLSSKKKK